MGTMVLRNTDDGRTLAESFPATIDVSRHVLEHGYGFLERRFRVLDLRFANGRAVYRLECRGAWCSYRARRLYAEPIELECE
jgi:hypothetical protein